MIKPIYFLLAAMWAFIGISQIQNPSPFIAFVDIIVIVSLILVTGSYSNFVNDCLEGHKKTLNLLEKTLRSWRESMDTIRDMKEKRGENE